MKKFEILNKAADRLSKPGAWTQGNYARDEFGALTAYASPYAVCWCALGAIAVETGSLLDAERVAKLVKYPADLVNWNDDPSRTQDEVVAELRNVADRLSKWGE